MLRRFSCLVCLALLACSGSRGERVGSVCLTDEECGPGGVCEAQICTDSASASTAASVTGRIAGAPEGARIEQRAEDDQACEPKKSGLVCSVAKGARLVLIAPEIEGYRFVEWTGAGACKSKKRELELKKVDASLECTANYVRQLRVTGVVGDDEGALVLASAEGEFAKCEGNSCLVDRGQTVTLTAPQRDGLRITGFEGEGCEAIEGYRVTVTPDADDVVCTASYVESLTVRGQVQGIAEADLARAQVVANSPSETALCAEQSCAVDPGQSVTLLAPEVEGYRFAGWTGDPGCASSDAEITLPEVGANLVCTADYVRRFRVRGVSEGAEAMITARADSGFPACEGDTCEVDEGVTVTLLAGTVRGYRLERWSGEGCTAGSGSSASAHEVHEDRTCTAHFVEGVAVSGTVVNAEAEVDATSSSDGAECEGGRCVITPGGAVALTAPNLPGRTFVGWSGDEGCTGRALSITLSDVRDSADCLATFAPRYTGEGKPIPTAGGRVVASASAGNPRCSGAACEVDEGSSVVLTATAADRFRFTGWTGGGACTGSNARLELRNLRANLTCNANFIARIQVSGTVAPSGAATVTATSLTSSAQCSGASCTVDSGSNVLLTAREAAGYRFTRWSGCGNALNPLLAGNPLLVAGPTTDERCTANFERITYTLTAEAGTGGSAQVRTGNCSSTSCTAEYGASATFTATPATGYQLASWDGECRGTNNSVSVASVRANMICSASFERVPVTASGAPSPAGGGSVTARSSTTGNRCGGASCTVPYGGAVTLEASANTSAGYDFVRWSGCTGQANGASITLSNLNANTTCTANFQLRSYTVYGAVGPSGAGSASCMSGCQVTHGSRVTFVANANTGYRFDRWSGSGCPTGGAEISFTATGGLTCTANFVRQYKVTVLTDGSGGTASCGSGGQNVCWVDAGTSVPLRATQGSGAGDAPFYSWEGCQVAQQTPNSSVGPLYDDVVCTAVFYFYVQ